MTVNFAKMKKDAQHQNLVIIYHGKNDMKPNVFGQNYAFVSSFQSLNTYSGEYIVKIKQNKLSFSAVTYYNNKTCRELILVNQIYNTFLWDICLFSVANYDHNIPLTAILLQRNLFKVNNLKPENR